jgi:hypothetical protein
LQTCFRRNRDPKGARNAKQKTECRWAPESPEAVTEHKTGYKTADTLQSKVVICTRPAEVQRNGGAIRADISSARTAIVGTDVADRKNLIRLLQDAQDTRSMAAEMAEMVRRAQALAHHSGTALRITRELIGRKLTGQEEVARHKLLDSATADAIAQFRVEVPTGDSITTIWLVESQAAASILVSVEHPTHQLPGE